MERRYEQRSRDVVNRFQKTFGTDRTGFQQILITTGRLCLCYRNTAEPQLSQSRAGTCDLIFHRQIERLT